MVMAALFCKKATHMLTIRVNASRQINQGVEFEWFVQWVERLHALDFTVGTSRSLLMQHGC